jgi:mono/diheme cytochrome c family protein
MRYICGAPPAFDQPTNGPTNVREGGDEARTSRIGRKGTPEQSETSAVGIYMRFLSGFLAALGLLFIVGLAIVWSGAYNVAATAGHTGPVRWIFDTTLHYSVESRADEVPQALFRNADLQAGFRDFQEYCVHCHGAPGVETHEWASGMVPNPPELSKAVSQWSQREIFWIVKHGIKMTGMPAFGDSESDETIRNITAFVDRMEGMSPEKYSALRQQWASSGGNQEGAEGEAGHGSHSH